MQHTLGRELAVGVKHILPGSWGALGSSSRVGDIEGSGGGLLGQFVVLVVCRRIRTVHVGCAGGLVNGHCCDGQPGGCGRAACKCFAVCRGLIRSITTMTRACEEETRELRAEGASRAQASMDWCGVWCEAREFTSPRPPPRDDVVVGLRHPSQQFHFFQTQTPARCQGNQTKQAILKPNNCCIHTVSKNMSLQRDD